MNTPQTIIKYILRIMVIVLISACRNEFLENSPEKIDPTQTNTNESFSNTGNADVLFVSAVIDDEGSWTFHVTVQHPDTGWEDYADGWDVLTLEGLLIKPDPDSEFTRTLLHPHIDEQPFTRSQGGLKIPSDVHLVRVRAHDIVAGFGGKEIIVDLTTDSGTGFDVIRTR